MSGDNSVTIGDHFSTFVRDKINQGRYESVSEVIRAGLRLLEAEETRLELLKEKLSIKHQEDEMLLELPFENPHPLDEQNSDQAEVNRNNDFMHELSDFRKNKLT